MSSKRSARALLVQPELSAANASAHVCGFSMVNLMAVPCVTHLAFAISGGAHAGPSEKLEGHGCFPIWMRTLNRQRWNYVVGGSPELEFEVWLLAQSVILSLDQSRDRNRGYRCYGARADALETHSGSGQLPARCYAAIRCGACSELLVSRSSSCEGAQ